VNNELGWRHGAKFIAGMARLIVDS